MELQEGQRISGLCLRDVVGASGGSDVIDFTPLENKGPNAHWLQRLAFPRSLLNQAPYHRLMPISLHVVINPKWVTYSLELCLHVGRFNTDQFYLKRFVVTKKSAEATKADILVTTSHM